ncbi:MAG TPA: hypothetical protein VHP13_00220 [Gammaproteobacteria bacterium]|jgi:hypothetical protein|nr:hypothetical protein [Gammaproteobacteria bacterium]
MTMHMHRAWLLPALLLASAAARSDVGDDWLAKVPPPPKTLAEAQARCGEQAPHPRSWDKLGAQLQAASDKLEQDLRTRMSDPKVQQDMAMQSMAASMDPASAMAQMHYSQYLGGLGPLMPDVRAQTLLDPPFKSAESTVDAVLDVASAKLKKCPMQDSEAGRFPIESCQKPIDADSTAKKDAAANQYLAAVTKAWPQFLKDAQDYFRKAGAVPDGVDPKSFNVMMQRDNLPVQELAAVKLVSQQSEQACTNAVQLAAKFVYTDY